MSWLFLLQFQFQFEKQFPQSHVNCTNTKTTIVRLSHRFHYVHYVHYVPLIEVLVGKASSCGGKRIWPWRRAKNALSTVQNPAIHSASLPIQTHTTGLSVRKPLLTAVLQAVGTGMTHTSAISLMRDWSVSRVPSTETVRASICVITFYALLSTPITSRDIY